MLKVLSFSLLLLALPAFGSQASSSTNIKPGSSESKTHQTVGKTVLKAERIDNDQYCVYVYNTEKKMVKSGFANGFSQEQITNSIPKSSYKGLFLFGLVGGGVTGVLDALLPYKSLRRVPLSALALAIPVALATVGFEKIKREIFKNRAASEAEFELGTASTTMFILNLSKQEVFTKMHA